MNCEEDIDLNKKVEDDAFYERGVSFNSSIDEARKIMVDINSLIKNGNLKEGDRREWEKRLNDLQEVIWVEVDNRIASESQDAVTKRDNEWKLYLAQQYVKKEDATELENTIKSKDATIDQLRNEIAQKDAAVINKQNENSQLKDFYQGETGELKDQIGKLVLEKQNLINDNWKKHNIIQDNAAKYEQREQEYVKRDRKLSDEKIKFSREVKEQELIQDKSFLEADKKYKEIETREEELAERELQLKKRDDELDKKIQQAFGVLKERLKEVEEREKSVNVLGNELLMQKKNLAVEKRKIDDYKEYQLNEVKLYKEQQMEEIKNEKEKMSKDKEKIEKTKGELKAWDQRLRKMERTLKKIFGYYGYSNIYKSFSNNDQVGIKDQETTEDKKPVTLRLI